MKKRNAILLAVLTSAILQAAEDAVCIPPVCGKYEHPLMMDGKFFGFLLGGSKLEANGEKAWLKSRKLPVEENGGPPDTDIYTLHDRNFLYFGIHCRNESQDIAITNVKARDNPRIWYDSSVELFIAPDGAGKEFQLIMNSAGFVYDAIEQNKSFDLGVGVGVRWDPFSFRDYYLECAIPIAEVDPSREFPEWSLRVTRTFSVDGKKTVNKGSGMKPLKISFDPAFYKKRNISAEMKLPGISPGKNVVKITLSNPDRIRNVMTGYAIRNASGPIPNFKRTNRRLTGNPVEELNVEYEIPNKTGTFGVTIALDDVRNGQNIASRTAYANLVSSKERGAALDADIYRHGQSGILFFPGSVSGKLCEIRISDAASGTSVFETRLSVPRNSRVELPQIAKLPPGGYRLAVKFPDGSGKETSMAFIKSPHDFFRE